MSETYMIDKFLEALDDNREYEYISTWYNDMSKFDLRTILLEYVMASRRCTTNDGVYLTEAIQDEVRENLEAAICKI